MSTTTEIRERPILFSGPMVLAILEGRKTQTRRVVKPQIDTHRVAWGCRGGQGFGWFFDDEFVRCPYGESGDLLYVREAWAAHKTWDKRPPRAIPSEQAQLYYRAVDPHQSSRRGRWRPSIHMPKWAARIWLRVTDVRVERVQEISVDDIRAEGVRPGRQYGTDHSAYEIAMRAAFRDLWDSINADRGHPWDSNPWVWVVEFERAEAP